MIPAPKCKTLWIIAFRRKIIWFTLFLFYLILYVGQLLCITQKKFINCILHHAYGVDLDSELLNYFSSVPTSSYFDSTLSSLRFNANLIYLIVTVMRILQS